VLSLPIDRVIEYTADPRNPSISAQETQLFLNIISQPWTENFPSPLKLVGILNNRLLWLSTLLANLNTLQTITGSEYQPYVPKFVQTPLNNYVDYYTCGVTAELDSLGYIFMIATEAASDSQKPNANQVFWGFNSSNHRKPSVYTQVNKSFTFSNLTIGELNPNTDYNLYLITGSAHPGYPDLPDDSAVVLVGCRTPDFPPSNNHSTT
jgi:hypothetical protein